MGKNLWTLLPSPLLDNMILLNAPQQCSSFVVVILFEFLYWSDLILEHEHVHVFNPVPSVGVHKAVICKYHHASWSLSSGEHKCTTRHVCPKTCRPQVHVLLLILLWPWPWGSPKALSSQPLVHHSLWTLWVLAVSGWLHIRGVCHSMIKTSNYTMHRHVIYQPSPILYTLLC